VTDHDRVRHRRVQYDSVGIEPDDLHPDPVEQWHRWHRWADTVGAIEPNAMTLATVDAEGRPDARVLLVRGVDERGLTFFSNYESAKSRQLAGRPAAAATFAWLDLHLQVRVRGRVERITDAENDEYFASRPRASQIGAWASPQSEELIDRAELEGRVEAAVERFASLPTVPRPPFWGGWRLVPAAWEFWSGRPSRLHDRVAYLPIDGGWRRVRLAP
jgi:pyridoxamine 5'-phosphate oxidase